MTRQTRWLRPLAPLGLLAGLVACDHQKTQNPLSPLIAGPIRGVTITQPGPLEPAANRKFKPAQQPITLMIANPSSNSPRPYTLRIDMATTADFSGQVETRAGITPGANGTTSFVLPGALPAGRIYYWRVKAEDGANASDFGEVRAFEVLEPVIIGAPSAASPTGGGRITTRRPDLVVNNAAVSGPHLPLFYLFEVATDAGFANRVVYEERLVGSGQTVLTVPHDLAVNTTHFWRARVTDTEVTGNWSVTESFLTPLPATSGGSGSGALPPGNCALSDGSALVACIAAKYPSYLAAGVSLHERENNMAFLRDRIIEAGICGGLNLGWNKKRGNGPHSIDALGWRLPGGDEVVDIGASYDDTSKPLQLQWGIVAGPSGFDGYSPRPTCG